MSIEETFEEGLKRLQSLNEELNRDDLTLDQSTKLFQEAQKLGEKLHHQLDEAELIVRNTEQEVVNVKLDDSEGEQ